MLTPMVALINVHIQGLQHLPLHLVCAIITSGIGSGGEFICCLLGDIVVGESCKLMHWVTGSTLVKCVTPINEGLSEGRWVQIPWKAALVFPCRNCLFNDLTLHLKDLFSTSSCWHVSLMAQWISTCTLTDKGCGFKPHGRLQWSFLAEKVSLMTSHFTLRMYGQQVHVFLCPWWLSG